VDDVPDMERIPMELVKKILQRLTPAMLHRVEQRHDIKQHNLGKLPLVLFSDPLSLP
jgi:hypothetical protein